jgi:hypothetical protein
MELPFHLAKLPPEAQLLLRYMLTHSPLTSVAMENAGLSARSVGKAIRRLINGDYLELKGLEYALTTNGRLAGKQLIEYEAAMSGLPVEQDNGVLRVRRRVLVVTPRIYVSEHAADLFIGVNPPSQGDERLPYGAQIELRVSAVGGKLSINSLSIDIPPEKAAVPTRVRLLPEPKTPAVRVRVDAFQTFEIDHSEAVGGFYFDIPVYADASKQDKSPKAVGIDITLSSAP